MGRGNSFFERSLREAICFCLAISQLPMAHFRKKTAEFPKSPCPQETHLLTQGRQNQAPEKQQPKMGVSLFLGNPRFWVVLKGNHQEYPFNMSLLTSPVSCPLLASNPTDSERKLVRSEPARSAYVYRNISSLWDMTWRSDAMRMTWR